MSAAFAVQALNRTRPIDVRSTAPASLRESLDALFQVVASMPLEKGGTQYLPDEFLTALR